MDQIIFLSGVILLCLECILLISVILSYVNKKSSASDRREYELPSDYATRRKMLAEDTDGKFFDKIKNAAKSNVKPPDSPFLESQFESAGFISVDDKRFVIWGIAFFCFAGICVGVIAWFLLESSLNALALFLSSGLIISQLIIFLEIIRRQKLRERTFNYWLPISIEQLIASVIATHDITAALQALEKIVKARDSINPVNRLFLDVLESNKNGVELSQAFIQAGRSAGHLNTKHLFLSLSRFVKNAAEIIKPLLEISNSILDRLPKTDSDKSPDATQFKFFIQMLLPRLRSGIEPLAAIIEIGPMLKENSRLEMLISHLIDSLKKGGDTFEILSQMPALRSVPEFEIFIQGLMLSQHTGGRLSNILDRINLLMMRRGVL